VGDDAGVEAEAERLHGGVAHEVGDDLPADAGVKVRRRLPFAAFSGEI